MMVPPIDPKVLEEQQKALQDAMQKQQDELRKRLENTPPAATGRGCPGTSCACDSSGRSEALSDHGYGSAPTSERRANCPAFSVSATGLPMSVEGGALAST